MIKDWTIDQLDAELRRLCDMVSQTVSPFGDVEGAEDREARMAACREDVELFALTYFPAYCRQPFAPMHGEMIELTKRRNTPQVVAGFRGSAKSTVIDFFVPMHEVLFKTCHFYMFGSASTEIAVAEYALPIMAHLKTNPRIINDFGVIPVTGEQSDFMAGEVRVLSFGRRSSVKGKKNGPWRPDRIRLADIEDRNNMMSPAVCRKTTDWIENDVLEAVGNGADEEWSCIYEFNYFSKKTVGHQLMSRPNWRSVVFPAIIARPSDMRGLTAVSLQYMSAWPERYPLAMLRRKQSEAPATFEVEWQQNPRDDESMFRREWIRYYKPDELPVNLAKFGWCDPSASEKESADFKAYGYIGVNGNDIYVVKVHVRHETTNQMIDAMLVMQHDDPTIRLWGIEGIVFEVLIRDLVEQAAAAAGMHLPIMPITKVFANWPMKKDRIPKMQSIIERGRIYFPANDPDAELLIQQLLDYPDGRNDDGPDMLSGAVELSSIMGPKQEIFVKL